MKIRRFNENVKGTPEYRFLDDILTELVDEFTDYDIDLRDMGSYLRIDIENHLNQKSDIKIDHDEFKNVVKVYERHTHLLKELSNCLDTIKNSDFIGDCWIVE